MSNTDFLRQVSLFKCLSDEELEAIRPLWAFRQIAPRERIVAEGAEMHEFFVICAGVVHVRRRTQDHEVLLARIDPGGFFGEMNLYHEGTATASVYSMGEVKLATVADAALREFLNTHQEIGYKITVCLLEVVSQRLRQTNEKLVHSMFWPTNSLAGSPAVGA